MSTRTTAMTFLMTCLLTLAFHAQAQVLDPAEGRVDSAHEQMGQLAVEGEVAQGDEDAATESLKQSEAESERLRYEIAQLEDQARIQTQSAGRAQKQAQIALEKNKLLQKSKAESHKRQILADVQFKKADKQLEQAKAQLQNTEKQLQDLRQANRELDQKNRQVVKENRQLTQKIKVAKARLDQQK